MNTHNALFLVVTYFSLILGVAFLVLTERAVLSLSQSRKSPNIVSPWGVVQCVTDSVNLITNSSISLTPTSAVLYSLSPIILTMLTMILICTSPMPLPISMYSYNILLMFSVLSLISLPFILLSFSYGSVYSTISAVRVVSLIISYEILLLILIMFFKSTFGNWSWTTAVDSSVSISNGYSRCLLIVPIIVLWLMELSRTPFDLAESESELVSGFNVEYSGWSFLFFFFSEMLCLLTISLIFSVLICQVTNFLNVASCMLLFVIISLYVRAALPRFRLLDTQNYVWFRLTPWVMLFGNLSVLFSCI